MKNKHKETGLVYSTEFGKMCPECNQSKSKCICRRTKSIPESDGLVRLMRQTKGKKGKGVTLISGIPLDHGELKNLMQSLKKKCGSGGTLKEGIIEIQGEHRDMLEKELVCLGYKVKRAGG